MPKRILIITLTNIGDVLLTLPSIQVMREEFAFDQISVVVGERAELLFRGDPRFKKVWIWKKHLPWRKKISLMLEIGKEGFTHVVNFRNPVWRPHGKPLHRRMHHFQKLVDKGIVTSQALKHVNGQQALWISEAVENKAKELLRGQAVDLEKRWIVITPGSLSMTKRWRLEGWVKLCHQLTETRGDQILLAGDESDQSRSQEIVKRVSSSVIFDFCGKTQLLELAWFIRQARLLISHDSAPLHMASLLGTPVIALFGPTDPEKYGPWRENSRVVRKPLFCSPCEKSLCVFHHECMNQIQPEEILKAVDELLKDSNSPQNIARSM